MFIICITPNTNDASIIDLITEFLSSENLSINSFCNQPLHKNSSAIPTNILNASTFAKLSNENDFKETKLTPKLISAIKSIGIPKHTLFQNFPFLSVNT